MKNIRKKLIILTLIYYSFFIVVFFHLGLNYHIYEKVKSKANISNIILKSGSKIRTVSTIEFNSGVDPTPIPHFPPTNISDERESILD